MIGQSSVTVNDREYYTTVRYVLLVRTLGGAVHDEFLTTRMFTITCKCVRFVVRVRITHQLINEHIDPLHLQLTQ